MSIFSAIRRRFAKSGGPLDASGFTLAGFGGRGEVQAEAPLADAIYFAALTKLSSAVAEIPLDLVNPAGEKVPLTDAAARQIAAILARPNPHQRSWRAMMEAAAWDYTHSGAAFFTVEGDGAAWLMAPRAAAVTELQYLDWPKRHWQWRRPDGRLRQYAADDLGDCDLLAVERVRPDDTASPISAGMGAGTALAMHENASRWNAALMRRGAAPQIALTQEYPTGPEQMQILRAQAEDMLSGPRNAGRPMLLPVGVKAAPLSPTGRDADWDKGMQRAAAEIAGALHVPSQVIGIPGSQTFANYEQAVEAMHWEAFRIAGAFAEALSEWLLPRLGMAGWSLAPGKTAALLAAEATRRTMEMAAMNGISFLTINEKRARLGLEPVDGGDVLDGAPLMGGVDGLAP